MSAGTTTFDNASADAWRPAVNPWIIAITVTLATFMEVLDTSIANVALPHIAGSLSAGQDESTWVLTSYLVSNAIVLPLSGWLSSIVGRKNFYMGCVALFTISSFLCGLAPNLATLIICRVLQGAGGGGLQPSEQAILADTFPPAKRGMAFAVYGIAVVTAPAILADGSPTISPGAGFSSSISRSASFLSCSPRGSFRTPLFSGAASSAKPRSITSASVSSPWAWALCRLSSTKASATIGLNRISSWSSP
jgi:MFS family permease